MSIHESAGRVEDDGADNHDVRPHGSAPRSTSKSLEAEASITRR